MLKSKRIILSILVCIFISGYAYGKDLSPEQLQAMLGKVEQQKFDTRDSGNEKIVSSTIEEKAAGVFKIVERRQSLKAQISVPTVFGSLLTKNNLALKNSPQERSNLFAPLFNIRLPEIIWTIIRDRKSFMLSSLPATSWPGLSILAISFLIVCTGILPFLDDPVHEFRVKLE